MQPSGVIDDRFELQAVAGEGGMGRVYRALDRRTGQIVALKLVRDPDVRATARFAYEAGALAELSHPNIVRYITHGVTPGGEPYLVMEWLAGETLEKRLKRVEMSVDESVRVACAAAEALGAAHARSIVHRDVKPANLLLSEDGVEDVKVLDFGIARGSGLAAGLTKTNTFVGTPGYMAPEQVVGTRGRVDARADVFALGCVLFECLTGRPAFQAQHVRALLAKLLIEEAPRVRELRPEVPAALDELLRCMLSKDPEERPANGAAVAALLSSLWGLSGQDAAPSVRALEVITNSERRLVSVVAVRPVNAQGLLPEATLPAYGGVHGKELQELRRILEPRGARVEELPDGTLIAALIGAGGATDQAAIAARGALRMQWLLPDAAVVLVTGRGQGSGALPLGEALERAAAMLEERCVEAGRRRHVRVDEVTQALLDVRFEVTAEGERILLFGERPVGHEARTLLGKPSPFLGRERELRSLQDLIEESFEEEQAGVALVTAAAGMGKSRLRYEVVRYVQERYPTLAFAIGRGELIGAGSPFVLVSGALRGAFGIEAGGPAEVQRQRLLYGVGLHLDGDARARAVEFLGELMGIPPLEELSPRLRAARQSAALMADQMRAAYVDFVRAVTLRHPALLVLEDLHWGDAPSIRLVGAALRELADRPFTVLAFARPEVETVFPRLWEERGRIEIRLTALPSRVAERIAQRALGNALDAGTLSTIVERAEGNAFYLEELIRAVAERRGAVLPETVLGMVEARLSALPPEARRLLRAASVFGGTFWRSGVRALLGEPISSAGNDRFAQLADMELIARRTEPRFAGEEEYVFRHALLREGAYAMLTEQDRALGHKLAAEWLLAAGELDKGVIAAHFERGNNALRAAGFYAQAAEQGLCGGDLEAAVAWADKGLACEPEGDLAAALHATQASARLMGGDYQQSYKSAERALELAAPGSPSACQAISTALFSAQFMGDRAALGSLLPRMLTIEPARGAMAPIAASFRALIVSLLLSGRRGVAEDHLRRMDHVVTPVLGSDALAAAWWELAWSDWALFAEQDPLKGIAHVRASERAFEALGDRSRLRYAREQRCFHLTLLGDLDGAEAIAGSVRDSGGEEGLSGQYHRYLRAMRRLLTGRLEEARSLAVSVRETARAKGEQLTGPAASLLLIESLLLEGALAAAEQEAAALGDGRDLLPSLAAALLSLRAEIRLRQGRAEEAAGLAVEARTANEAAGGLFYLRQEAIPLVYAEALDATGDPEGARVALRQARDELLARAAKIPDPEVRRGFLANIPARARTLARAEEWLGE